MILIENEGAIFRGNFVNYPLQVWSVAKQEWLAYKGVVPKPIEWGGEISEADAKEYMSA